MTQLRLPPQSPADNQGVPNVMAAAASKAKVNFSSVVLLPDMWMKVAASLGVPALGRLACTTSCFRAVLPSYVSTSAAMTSDAVKFTSQRL